MLKQRVCGSRTQGPNVRDPESHGGSLAALQMNFRAGAYRSRESRWGRCFHSRKWGGTRSVLDIGGRFVGG